MTTASPRAGVMALRGQKDAAAQGTLPLREPGARGPAFHVPRWRPGASGWAEPEPETMRRVSVALKRL